MKALKLKNINLLVIMLFCLSIEGLSQNTQSSSNTIMGTINATGTDASSSSGSVTYSIGQVFYTYFGLSAYNVAQGIQHDGSNVNLPAMGNAVEPKIEINIFPNPTTDLVNLNVGHYDNKNDQQSYQLFDLQGRLLLQNVINQTETQINIGNLMPSLYILRVNANDKVLKTFKVLKK